VSAGRILIGDRDVTGLEPYDRHLSMVFQSYALYPHMSVRDNIAFALRTARMPEAQVALKVAEAARMLQLEPLLDRRPRNSPAGSASASPSGGPWCANRRRSCSTSRCRTSTPGLRAETRIEIAALHRSLAATMIYVTHDQVEAVTLADRIVVLNGGRIEQIGRPMDLYNAPASTFVATFLGAPSMNLITGPAAAALGAETVGIRPEHLHIAEGAGQWTATVRHVEQLGADTLVYLDAGAAGRLTLRTPGQRMLEPGAVVSLGYDPAHLHRFRAGQRITGP
jgi:multiple sugar transport system ATP-binding protein